MKQQFQYADDPDTLTTIPHAGQYQGIPAQTGPKVHRYLRQLGSQWTGKGIAIELGSWLGGSAAPLLKGLKTAGYNKTFWAFESWIATRPQVEQAAQQNVYIKNQQDLRKVFLENISPIYSDVSAVKGRLPESLSQYDGNPIEICLFDAPKKEPVFSECIRALSKYWIPGVTVLGLLDFNFYRSKTGRARKASMAPVNFLRDNTECFTELWENGSPLFLKYEKELINI